MINRKLETIITKEQLIDSYKEIRDQIKLLEGQLDMVKKQLINHYFIDTDALQDEKGKVIATYKASIRIIFKTKEFEQHHKPLYDQYLDAIEVKTLLIK